MFTYMLTTQMLKWNLIIEVKLEKLLSIVILFPKHFIFSAVLFSVCVRLALMPKNGSKVCKTDLFQSFLKQIATFDTIERKNNDLGI